MKIYKYLLLSILLITLVSCSDERYDESIRGNKSFITLHLPKEAMVEINTRAGSDEHTVNDILILTFRNGVAKYESFISPAVNSETISLQLSTFSVVDGETLYACCNTGITTVNATNADDFFKELICTNSDTYMTMYGSIEISGSSGSVSLELKRAFAKASLTCSDGKNIVESWKLCNVPTKGFVSEKTDYPTETDFDKIVIPASTTDAAYFIPRVDNSSTTGNKTFMLVKLVGLGWYKLDFYNGTTGLDPAAKAPIMDLQRNTHYAFDIFAVQSAGYSSEAEAKANPGSNILYSMSSTQSSDSNGQYAIEVDRDVITLYPVADGEQALEALNIRAVIPTGADTDISTYTVKLVNPSNQIRLDGDDDNDKLLDLNKPIDLDKPNPKISSENSSRTIKLLFNGAAIEGSYLEVKLGNITRKIFINVLSANCYLVDFSTAVGTKLHIPIVQANLDGETRISLTDTLDIDIVWSDQPNIDLDMEYKEDKQWIVVKNKSTFTGNVVISVAQGGTIKWSWHIWSLGDDVIEYNHEMGIYDFKDTHTKKFNNFEFMNRNLGAYSLDKTSQGSWGLSYQWGRKDPFPISDIANPTEDQLIYYRDQDFTMEKGHPVLKECFATINNSPNNLEYAISHPLTFILGMRYVAEGKIAEFDWYTSNGDSRNNYLWLDKGRRKTPYNPCPAGWTLPHGGNVGPFVGLSGVSEVVYEKEGLTFERIGYVPYTTLRTASGGDIASISMDNANLSWGNYKNNTVCVTFFTAGIVHMDYTSRGDLVPTRCVRDDKL